MSVVIRDIDKPRDCDYCHFQTDSYCHVLLSYINVEHGVDTRCPIIEINEYTMKNGHKVVVADTPQTDCETCRHYKLACELFSEVCKYEPITQTETQNSNLTFDTPQTDCQW